MSTVPPATLRISYLFQQFPLPTETFAVSDIAELVAQGHQLSVFTLKPPRKDEVAMATRAGLPLGLAVHRPSLAGARSWPALLWRRRAEAAWLVRCILPHLRSAPGACLQALLSVPRLLEISEQLRWQGSDVVHAFWSRHVALVLPLLKASGAPPLRTAFLGAYDLVADDFIVDLAASSAEVLFSHAEVNRPHLLHKAAPGAEVEIVHRGIPLMEPTPGVERDPRRLITASALVESKNVEAVIRSFADARAEDSALRLDIYGDGPDRPRLEQLAERLGCADAVSFAGHVTRTELFAEMQRAAIFLLLTKKPSERLPNVLKEALWAGCGVISSRSDGIEELIPDEGIGLVLDPDDARAVGSGIARLLAETPREGEERRERARAFVAERFSSATSMRSYVKAWRGHMVEGHKSPELEPSMPGAEDSGLRPPRRPSPA